MASAEPIDGRCGAVVKPKPEQGREGGYCEKPPLAGQQRCGTHGGKAPQNLAAAERRQIEAAGRAYVAKYADPNAHIDWHEAIPLGIDEAYSNLLAMRQLVQSLAPEQLVWGKTEVVEILGSQFPGVNTTEGAGIHPWVEMYGQERDRLHKQSVDAGKLNLDARRQAFAERDAVDAVEAMRATWADPRMKATPEQLELAPRILAEKLRARTGLEAAA